MKKKGILFLLTTSLILHPLFSQNPVTPSQEELLFLHTISEFWKEGDWQIVKQKILSFLALHPETSYRDNLEAILGDLYHEEGDFANAVAAYSTISAEPFVKQTLYRHLQSLSHIHAEEKAVILAEQILSSYEASTIPYYEEILFLLAKNSCYVMRDYSDIEIKRKWAAKAKSFYEKISNSFVQQSFLPLLAEIELNLGSYDLAYSYYTDLAKQYPEKEEEFLLEAAGAQLLFDKKGAIETYEKIYSLHKEKASFAAYNQFVLLLQERMYEELIQKASSIYAHLTEEQKPSFNFWLAKSYFNLGHIREAGQTFILFLAQNCPEKELTKAALLHLL